jgi:2-(3-amino-3-carboxypropyl)histidine synthase
MSKTPQHSTYYDLELERLAEKVNTQGARKVVLQFPDGLKYYAGEVVDELREKTDAEFFIYFGPCFGACDVPLHLKQLDFDMCVQWGHAPYIKRKGMW